MTASTPTAAPARHDDGGPAFPIGDQSLHPLMLGMSLRDFFAIHAFTARLNKLHDYTRSEMVEDAWADADAMLAERAK